MPVIAGGKVIEGAIGRQGGLVMSRYNYSFAVDGGAVSTITLRNTAGPALIPSGAVVEGGYIDVTTAVASATGTVAVQAEAAADVLAATGQAGLTLGRKSVIPAFTGATGLKATADRAPAIVIATAALTAGVFDVVLFWAMP